MHLSAVQVNEAKRARCVGGAGQLVQWRSLTRIFCKAKPSWVAERLECGRRMCATRSGCTWSRSGAVSARVPVQSTADACRLHEVIRTPHSVWTVLGPMGSATREQVMHVIKQPRDLGVVLYSLCREAERRRRGSAGVPTGNSDGGEMALQRLVTPTMFACRVRRQRAA